ncbi:MAG: glycosyltransferase family 2 protein [Candidatus Bathyarchaeota archaeon]|nr:glycosyltransferase family 2 protein [Candidatus Bathyarchaeota archaeon]
MQQLERSSFVPQMHLNAKTKPLVVVGIPAFNEEKTIANVVLQAQKFAIVVVCDDGSVDLTAEIAERLGAVVVRHERNSGYGAALQSLFRRAQELDVDILVTLDGDGQHNPEEIPRLIEPIKSGYAQVVLGSRFKDTSGTADMPFYRKLGVKLITKLASGSGKTSVSDAQSGFRAYSKDALDHLLMFETGMSASVELLREINKNDLTVCEVPISCKYADSVGVETSTQNPISHGVGLVMSIVKLVVEDKPLFYLGLPGIVLLTIGALFGVWLLDLYASLNVIMTNVALASTAFLLLGFFMLSTGITLYAIARVSSKINGRK